MKGGINKTVILFLLTAAVICVISSVAIASDSGNESEEVIALVPAEYGDVPATSWAVQYIAAATESGLMQGDGNGGFGYGRNISRSEFVTILCRMMQWSTEDLIHTEAPQDVPETAWYHTYVMTAAAHDVVEATEVFRPGEDITREEMAVMLVKALRYDDLAHDVAAFSSLPFEDVSENEGHIAIARDIGMINGVTETSFAPQNPAKREEAAAMIVRVYERMTMDNEFFHGFYAFSSYPQREYAAEMDAVTFGWSRMCLDEAGVWLNTSGENDNEWRIPSSSETILEYLEDAGTKMHLGVYMDMSQKYVDENGETVSSLSALLQNKENAAKAVELIVEEALRTHPVTGKAYYSGITIDFEGIRQNNKEYFTEFVTLLYKTAVGNRLSLYITVQPAVYEDSYYDGYDFRQLSVACDKIILMAHDYNPTSMKGFLGTSWHRNAALTPFAKVYYSLKVITDPETGVADAGKVALAISFSSIGWEISDNLLVNESPVSPSVEVICQRLAQDDTLRGRSGTLRNPFVTYTTGDGRTIFLWYEDSESVSDKIQLAKMFGVNSVSIWRLGTIPDHDGVYDVWGDVLSKLK